MKRKQKEAEKKRKAEEWAKKAEERAKKADLKSMQGNKLRKDRRSKLGLRK